MNSLYQYFDRLRPISFILFSVICFCLIENYEGGLLSANLHPKSYYVVKQINEVLNNKINRKWGDQLQKYREDIPRPSQLSLITSYTDCGSTAHIRSLRVNSCDSAKQIDSICEIERGSNVTFNLSFIPRSNATQLKAVIHGIIDYVPIPLPCPQPDACLNSGIECPLYAGKKYDYTLEAAIKESYPRMKLWVKGQLEDEEGENVICVKIHVQIV